MNWTYNFFDYEQFFDSALHIYLVYWSYVGKKIFYS